MWITWENHAFYKFIQSTYKLAREDLELNSGLSKYEVGDVCYQNFLSRDKNDSNPVSLYVHF